MRIVQRSDAMKGDRRTAFRAGSVMNAGCADVISKAGDQGVAAGEKGGSNRLSRVNIPRRDV